MSFELIASIYSSVVLSPWFLLFLIAVFLYMLVIHFACRSLEKDLAASEARWQYERGKNNRIIEENKLLMQGMKAMSNNRFEIYIEREVCPWCGEDGESGEEDNA